jgi:hypothetical protein
VAVPAARVVRVWCEFPSGSFTVAHATRGGRAATTPSTSWARLRAALRSRSSTRPHLSHRNVRSDRRSLAFTTPQAEQVLEEGYQRSATCTVLPAQPVLYSIWRRSSPQPTPATRRARRRLRSIPATPEVLDHYRAVLADEPGGQSVQAVTAALATAVWSFAMRARVLRHRREGTRRVRLSGPTRRQAWRARRRSSLKATSRWRGLAGDLLGRQHRQELDAEVDTHHRIRPSRGRVVAFDRDRERAEPPSALVGDGGRADTAGAAFDMPGELAGGLVGAHQAEAGQLDMPAVGVGQAERAGGEPARHAESCALESREPDLRPPAGAVLRRVPVTQRDRQVSQARRVRLPWSFPPTTARWRSSSGSTISADCRPTTTTTT